MISTIGDTQYGIVGAARKFAALSAEEKKDVEAQFYIKKSLPIQDLSGMTYRPVDYSLLDKEHESNIQEVINKTSCSLASLGHPYLTFFTVYL